jgi:hypothetical protein
MMRTVGLEFFMCLHIPDDDRGPWVNPAYGIANGMNLPAIRHEFDPELNRLSV